MVNIRVFTVKFINYKQSTVTTETSRMSVVIDLV